MDENKAKLAQAEAELDKLTREQRSKILAQAKSMSDPWTWVAVFAIFLLSVIFHDKEVKTDWTGLVLVAMALGSAALANRRVTALIRYLEVEKVIKP